MSGFSPSSLVWYRGFLSQVHDLSTAPGRVGFSKQYLLLLLLLMEFIDGSMMSRAGCGRMKVPDTMLQGRCHSKLPQSPGTRWSQAYVLCVRIKVQSCPAEMLPTCRWAGTLT